MAPAADVSLVQHTGDLPTADILLSKSIITTSVQEIPLPTARPHTYVLNPAFVTQDFDALRFKAAAYSQLPSKDSLLPTPSSHTDSDSDAGSTSPAYSTSLISSPYNNPGHYLDLTTLNDASRLFALALTALKPTRPDYATAPYTASLNFDDVLSVLRDLSKREEHSWKETSFYVVVFRSKLNSGVDQEWLYKLDYESHREACESGGLLKYWFGKADLEGQRRNLATCKCIVEKLADCCADCEDRLLAFKRGCVSGWVGAVACEGASGGEVTV
jgi:hypothetical protein